jgi:hypothetical protein
MSEFWHLTGLRAILYMGKAECVSKFMRGDVRLEEIVRISEGEPVQVDPDSVWRVG